MNRQGKTKTAGKKAAVKKPANVFQVIRDGVVFELQSEPEGGYTISMPALPGCISYGHTFEEAMEMIKDAMKGWLAVAREEGVPIPEQFEATRLART
jgi:antitoxin HicB